MSADGGPAFGRTYAEVERDRMQLGMEPAKTPYGHDGMTLRDYFAAKALAVMCASNVNASGTFATPEGRATVASVCYLMADAMLLERSK